MGRVLVITLALLWASAAHALTLGFAPASGSGLVGSSIEVGVVVSDLTDGGAPSLGSFDLDLIFDSAVLGLTGVPFGDPLLGDQLDLFGFGSLSGYDDSVPGSLNVFEISFDLPEDLDELQAGSFTLFTLRFDLLSPGTSALAFGSVTLGDAFGDPLIADAVLSGSVSALPEPTAAVLAALAGLLLALRRSNTI